MAGIGYTDRFLSAEETREIVRAGLASLSLAGKRVLFIIPDGTRTMPMPQFFGLFQEMLGGKVAALDFLVALGTHRPMDDAELSRLVGVPVVDGRAGESPDLQPRMGRPRDVRHDRRNFRVPRSRSFPAAGSRSR